MRSDAEVIWSTEGDPDEAGVALSYRLIDVHPERWQYRSPLLNRWCSLAPDLVPGAVLHRGLCVAVRRCMDLGAELTQMRRQLSSKEATNAK